MPIVIDASEVKPPKGACTIRGLIEQLQIALAAHGDLPVVAHFHPYGATSEVGVIGLNIIGFATGCWEDEKVDEVQLIVGTMYDPTVRETPQ